MIRKIIKIDEEKCNGCGLCVDACHEGAIAMVKGKAKLIRDDYCDGLGDCLPVCPTNAISFEEREAATFDEKAVIKNMKVKKSSVKTDCGGGCPGMKIKELTPKNNVPVINQTQPESQLRQWPVQIKLVPVKAPYFNNSNLLIAADCTAYAYGDFHNRFMKNRIVLIGCPKLDTGSYVEKLTEIIKQNNIKSVMVVRMEVPCCGGMEAAVKSALINSGKMVPWQVITISADGQILE